jgi:3,4-dihydroxy 2-butanone 4-phosphate synthase / GTP cyclohydrolase II
MARRPELLDFAAEHGLVMIAIDDLVAYRNRVESRAERVVATRLPTLGGGMSAVGYRGVPDGREHVALVAGDVAGADVPVHVHVECLAGDVFGSLRCSCARRLDAAMREIAGSGRGVVLYLRPAADLHRALRAQGGCVSRLDAPCGPLDPGLAVAVLDDLGVRSVRHLHNPAPVRAALDGLPGDDRASAPSGEVA